MKALKNTATKIHKETRRKKLLCASLCNYSSTFCFWGKDYYSAWNKLRKVSANNSVSRKMARRAFLGWGCHPLKGDKNETL